jgi:pSer/pThr/pTyr-binding forkhead associated (FHA) protein
LIDELTRSLREAGRESGLSFCAAPVVRVAMDPGLGPKEIRVIAQNSLEDISQTSDVATENNEKESAIPDNAFLIVDGTQVFPLGQRVINIGRRSDNQLAIDDGRISRLHAQLRAIRGHYVIFDLDSKGGTWVNGQRVRQRTLLPGDVISLAGVPLVFGQDDPDPGETQEFVPSP